MTSVKKKETAPDEDKVRKVDSIEITSVRGNTRTFVRLDGNALLYEFSNGRRLEVFNPRYLNTNDNKQRIICGDGTCLFIAPSEGWFVAWQNRNLLDENYRF